MSTSNFELERCYKLLNLPMGASLAQVESAYYKLKAEKILERDRQAIPTLKAAYFQLKTALAEQMLMEIEALERPEQTSLDQSVSLATRLKRLLEAKGFKQVQVQLKGSELMIELSAKQLPKASQGFIKIHPILAHLSQSEERFREVQSIQLLARQGARVQWCKQFKWRVKSAEDAHNLLSFDSPVTQTWTFPIVMIAAIAMNGIPIVKFLLRGINIWMHEFGHATVAWMSGRKAIPLPFGWTNVEPNKSGFVYFGILTLFGLLFWASRKENRTWPMVLAVVFAVIQFWATWIMSDDLFNLMLSFGGIGGEFYLCTVLMVSFYFPLPEYFKWDLYRYPVVLGSAFTFWGSFGSWRQIDRGEQSIPWGSLWGGQAHAGGDMNILSASGWSDQHIIDTYNTLGNVCLMTLLAVYFFFLLKQNRQAILVFWESCLAMF